MQTIDLIFGEIHPWDYRVTRNLNNSRRSINFPVAFQTVDHLGGLQDRLWSSVSRRWNYGPTRDPLLRYYISRMRGESPGLLHRGPPTIRLTLLRIILDRWNNKLDSTTFPNFILPFIVLLPKIQNIFPSIRFNQQLNIDNFDRVGIENKEVTCSRTRCKFLHILRILIAIPFDLRRALVRRARFVPIEVLTAVKLQ